MARTRRSDAHTAPEPKKAKTDANSSVVQQGDPLPPLEVTLQSESTINLAEKYAKGPLVIFSYPKASTPGCTKQTSGFGELYEKFQKLGAAVLGLSADKPKAQLSFKEKTKVEFDLISDPDFELISLLGAQKPPKSVVRSHFVFMDGKAVLLEHSVKPEYSPKAALMKVEELVGHAHSNGNAQSNGNVKPTVEKEDNDEEDADDEEDEGADDNEFDGDSENDADFDSEEIDEEEGENSLEEGEEDAEELKNDEKMIEGNGSEVGDDDDEGSEEGDVREQTAQAEDEDEGQKEFDDAKADAAPDAAETEDEQAGEPAE